jgi:hypothetical protein
VHARSRLLNWGVFLIVIGAFALAVQSGLVEAGAAGQLLRWWPILLIVIGLSIVLGRTAFPLLGGVLVAATAGLFVGALVAGGIGSFSNACTGGDAADGEVTTRNGTFTGLGGGRVELELTCVDLVVDRQPGSEWRIEFPAGGREPVIDATEDRLDVRSQDAGLFGGAQRNGWQVTLPQAPDLIVYTTLNASKATMRLGDGGLMLFSGTLNATDARLDLAAADMSRGPLNLALNASSTTVLLPESGTGASGAITVNASSLTLCVAPTMNLDLNAHETLSSNNFAAAGLAQSGERWHTSEPSTVGPRVELNITSNVSSITLDRSGGCP